MYLFYCQYPKGKNAQGCLCVRPSNMSVTSESPSNKAYVHPLRKYSSIFEHILENIQRIYQPCLIANGHVRPSVRHVLTGCLYPHVRHLWQPWKCQPVISITIPSPFANTATYWTFMKEELFQALEWLPSSVLRSCSSPLWLFMSIIELPYMYAFLAV
jgi:hypothetical protein